MAVILSAAEKIICANDMNLTSSPKISSSS